jgi:hypothetical protein
MKIEGDTIMKYSVTGILIVIGGLLAIYPAWSQTSGGDQSIRKVAPESTRAPDNTESALTIQFQNMNPHVGQLFEIRVIDIASMQEVTRQKIASIPGPNFQVILNGLSAGGYYWVDFFADFNGNGLYDPPPMDHAWRIDLNDLRGDSTVTFVHNLNFTDIDWVYQLELDVTDATPHVGNMFEARVVRQSDNMEMGRVKVDAVASPNFTVYIPGLHLNENYRVDFYFDLNHDGYYDPPPTDHAWRRTFTNPMGDAVVQFQHNLDFTDIDWKHLLIMNMNDMTPHLGQLFQLRVVDQGTGQETGRYTLPAILLVNFQVRVPALHVGHSYRADFYADLNGNGYYDPPPVDHAWRVFFDDNTGDVVQDFIHNTNFTDIEWPALGVETGTDPAQPHAFELEQNYPNPFNPSTTIAYNLPGEGFVKLSIYNMLGEQVATLVNQPSSAGRHIITWNADNHPSGIYFYQLSFGGNSATGKMMLLK